MALTKRQIIELAMTEIGYSSYQYDIEPDQLQDALHRLDAMMGEWDALGVYVGFPIPTDQTQADLDTDTALPDHARSAVYTNLAIRLCPMFGKSPSQELKDLSRSSLRTLKKSTTPIPQRKAITMPRGQGQKYWRSGINAPFTAPAEETLNTSSEEIELP